LLCQVLWVTFVFHCYVIKWCHCDGFQGDVSVQSKGAPVVITHKAPTESVKAVGQAFLYGSFVKVHCR
jgi:hypothetical protein